MRYLLRIKVFSRYLLNWPRFTWAIWFYFLNRKSRAAYRSKKREVDEVLSQAIYDLRQNGITMIDCADLVGEEAKKQLLESANVELNCDENQKRIDLRRKEIDKDQQGYKKYLLELWNGKTLCLENRLTSFILNERLLEVVNGYLGICLKLVEIDLWYNLRTAGPDVASQRWHRDPTDKRFLKVFVYLKDVDEDSGPFQYIRKSQDGGELGKLFFRPLPAGCYPKNADTNQAVVENRLVATGKAGTIIVCDTSGIHRGGHPKLNDRFLLFGYFLSDGAYKLNRFRKKNAYDLDSTCDQPSNIDVDYALSLWR